MTTNRPQNSILVLATLGVYLGLVFAFAGSSQAQTEEPNPNQKGVVINKRPLKVFVAEAKESIEKGAVIPSPVKFSLTAEIATDPKSSISKLANVRLLEGSTGDDVSKKLAIDAMLAMGDSGWFGYLYKVGAKKLRIDVENDGVNISIGLMSELKDAEEARSVSKTLQTFVDIGKGSANGDAKTLLDASTISSKDTGFVLNMTLPKIEFDRMLRNIFGPQDSLNK